MKSFCRDDRGLRCKAGLAVVVRGLVDRDTLGAALGLGKHQRIILAQSVGYPAGSTK